MNATRPFSDDKSTLVQVMAWCRQATSYYLIQWWTRSLTTVLSSTWKPPYLGKTVFILRRDPASLPALLYTRCFLWKLPDGGSFSVTWRDWSLWASYQIRKFAGAHAPGMPGTFSPSPQVSDPDMHHGTCVTHVPWCMPGSLTSGFLWNRRRGKTFPAFPAHAQPAILRIW